MLHNNKAQSLDMVLDGVSKEFFAVHAEITGLSLHTGVPAPKLKEAAAACGQTLDDGAVPLMQNAMMDAILGGAASAAGLGHVSASVGSFGANLALDARESRVDQEVASVARSFNRTAANTSTRSATRARTSSVLFGHKQPEMKQPAAGTQAAARRMPSLSVTKKTELLKAQQAKMAKFQAIMAELAVLNDMKAQGVQTVAKDKRNDWAAVEATVPSVQTPVRTAKTAVISRMFKPAFAPVPAFGGMPRLAFG